MSVPPQPQPQPQPSGPTLFIECTHASGSRMSTGIQRVVRNVLRNAEAAAERYGYSVVPVVFEDYNFVFTDADEMFADKPPPPAPAPLTGVMGCLRRAWRWLLQGLITVLPFAPVRRFLYASTEEFGLAWCLLLPLRLTGLRAWPEKRARHSNGLDQLVRSDDSILLLLDASWKYPIWPAVARFHQRGGKVAGVIYDMIPMTHPHTAVPQHVEVFGAWLNQHARHSDALIAISRSVANQIAAWLDTLSIRRRPAVDHFLLGSELDLIQDTIAVRPMIEAMFPAEQHVFLVVGSIEPRKNHAYVLDAFDRFWAQGGTASLVIIGHHGWKNEAFHKRIARHPRLDQKLFVVRDATDADLDHAYRNASALVIASEVEGFGLPVVEAFQRGLPVVCSDIPVFREIAEGKATFFDLADSGNLTTALAHICCEPVQRGPRQPQTWITWRESTDQLCAAIMRALGVAAT